MPALHQGSSPVRQGGEERREPAPSRAGEDPSWPTSGLPHGPQAFLTLQALPTTSSCAMAPKAAQRSARPGVGQKWVLLSCRPGTPCWKGDLPPPHPPPTPLQTLDPSPLRSRGVSPLRRARLFSVIIMIKTHINISYFSKVC